MSKKNNLKKYTTIMKKITESKNDYTTTIVFGVFAALVIAATIICSAVFGV